MAGVRRLWAAGARAVSPRDLTPRQAHLVQHAFDMGGWLSADYAQLGYRAEMADLQAHRVFEYIPTGPERYALTEDGRRLAEELG